MRICTVKGLHTAIIFSMMIPLTTLATPPTPNLSTFKSTLMRYHDSGEYAKDIEAVTQRALRYSKQRIADNQRSAHPKKLAAVFDIDETSLSNYANMRIMNFGGKPSAINKAERQGKDPAIPATRALYRYLTQHGVSVFFVTGRVESERAATQSNLNRAGYRGFKALILKPVQYNEPSAIPFKTSARRKIQAQGYDILFTMGDQYSDLKGGYADKTFKLPNPYYLIP